MRVPSITEVRGLHPQPTYQVHVHRLINALAVIPQGKERQAWISYLVDQFTDNDLQVLEFIVEQKMAAR